MNFRDFTSQQITREMLRAYADASADHNTIHLDEAAAREAGLPGIIAHGMLTMAFMGEFLFQALQDNCEKGALGQKHRVSEFNCRFRSKTFPGDVLTISCSSSKQEGSTITCEMVAKNQKGEVTSTGSAVIEI